MARASRTPVSAPAEASPARGTRAAAPASAVGTDAWPVLPDAIGARIHETVEGDRYTAQVEAPWGPVRVTGPATGVAGLVTRYWAAFSTAELDAVLAFAGPQMRARLSGYDHADGRVGFRDAIMARMTANPVVSFEVGPAEPPAGDRATVRSVSVRADGTREVRRVDVVRTEAGWRVDSVQLQR